jgi:hypothetical protein
VTLIAMNSPLIAFNRSAELTFPSSVENHEFAHDHHPHELHSAKPH